MLVVSLMRLGDEEVVLREQFPDVTFQFFKHPGELPTHVQEEMDVLISYHGAVDEAFIDAAPKLKWIAWYATGVNSLPLEKLQERNIKLTNGKGVHAQQLSEWLFAFILDDYKQLKAAYEEQQSKIYNRKRTGKTLEDTMILFLGTGVIPQRAAQIAKVFGMETIGLNTSGRTVDYFDKTYSIDEREAVFNQGDIIVNVLPETKETQSLLQVSDFKAMKDDALFINLGRGSIVSTETLVHVLNEKLIRAAYLDVFEEEPLQPDSPLYELDNVILTSHITGNGTNNKTKATSIFKRNLYAFLNEGELIENEVDLNKGY
ncbi:MULTISPECIES: phosphoglycerate dehydrogenase [unclassified Staphylococcus]|uniref:phosphoglycerate dehydrogenase n=1 Tax=unclassified Staphylococcus TaxID=91994 RepID=UPI0021CF3C23|nr:MULTISPECIES: phosphoglycerate dehydrogenase [unclassified Staphylococcus]UXR73240.1 phosphoglycerate dehydrogenase [Staphylococcus sp. IVB6238]UXR75538.1 phosphoglycerate dehydrogenase [Staphylococcus sp. IVB6233]UXR79740.1 phosphoglycerate dehydrogenase [Staphylococcus sp. IVB6218]